MAGCTKRAASTSPPALRPCADYRASALAPPVSGDPEPLIPWSLSISSAQTLQDVGREADSSVDVDHVAEPFVLILGRVDGLGNVLCIQTTHESEM